MKDRLLQLLAEEKMTSMKFAEIMEVQPSNISHILSGRNNPGYDFIARLLRRFPEISPDWIINGEGEMYRISTPNVAHDSKMQPEHKEVISNAVSIESDVPAAQILVEDDAAQNQMPEYEYIKPSQQSVENLPNQITVSPSDSEAVPKKIMVLYDDNTFEYYNYKSR